MKPILYRAKAINCNPNRNYRTDYQNGDWVYGLVSRLDEHSAEMNNTDGVSGIDVDRETIGEWTGLTDKNGNKIFEGDIVVTRYLSGDICMSGDVQFDCGVFGVEWVVHKKNKTMVGAWGQTHNLRRFDDDIIEHIEVVGDIYDNPELLEAQ